MARPVAVPDSWRTVRQDTAVEGTREHFSRMPEHAGAAQLAAEPPQFCSGFNPCVDGRQEHEPARRSLRSLYLHLKGIVPATTRRRQAKKQVGKTLGNG